MGASFQPHRHKELQASNAKDYINPKQVEVTVSYFLVFFCDEERDSQHFS